MSEPNNIINPPIGGINEVNALIIPIPDNGITKNEIIITIIPEIITTIAHSFVHSFFDTDSSFLQTVNEQLRTFLLIKNILTYNSNIISK